MGSVADGVWAIVVAGGSSSRFGRPKQFAGLGDGSVLDQSVRTARRSAEGVVAVVPEGGPRSVDGADEVVTGGTTRSESVRRGLAKVPAGAEVILVHDAARPLASTALFDAVVAAVRDGAEVVTPAIPVTDTLRSRTGGVVDRDALVAVQTPQGFRATVLRAAHDSGADATDDATLAESVGAAVVTVDGDRWNLKITEPDDLVVAEAIWRSRSGS
jgi:2-C-methyl-D-erythritol 4-phosphate cytidylyltransferase